MAGNEGCAAIRCYRELIMQTTYTAYDLILSFCGGFGCAVIVIIALATMSERDDYQKRKGGGA